MINKRVYLIENNENVFLDVYARDKNQFFTSKALLVISGGGYSTVVEDKEGEPIALSFMAYGYNKPAGMMLIYPEGPHGVALANDITFRGKNETVSEHTATWGELAAKWSDLI